MDLDDFRQRLNERLTQVLVRNEQANPHLRRLLEMPADWGEREVILADRALLDGLDTEARAELAAIRTALERVEDGTYGTCAGCGAPVGDTRLHFLPFAITCLRCAQR
ncbi:MAG: TraR/DksA family transcriptional regulator [Pseudomonadota bacterium]|nr:TraR/DksA family transcriptional regulator [Pseudomonadota bacterium]